MPADPQGIDGRGLQRSDALGVAAPYQPEPELAVRNRAHTITPTSLVRQSGAIPSSFSSTYSLS